MKKRNERGITIVALVVTIAILLILAGVTMGTLFGENGIVTKAQEAADRMEEATQKEQEDLENLAEQLGVTIEGRPSGDITLKNNQKLLTVTTCVGGMFRQKANYQNVRIEIKDSSSEAKMIVHVGTDAWTEVENDNEKIFDKNKFQVDLIKDLTNFTGDKNHLFASQFTHVVLKVAVENNKTYEINAYAQGGNGVNTGTFRTTWPNIGTVQTEVTNNVSVATSNDWKKMYDADGNGQPLSTDLAALRNAIKGVQPSRKVITVDDSYFYTEMMDENGNPKEDLKDFIGLDFNRDGLIDTKDSEKAGGLLSGGWSGR